MRGDSRSTARTRRLPREIYCPEITRPRRRGCLPPPPPCSLLSLVDGRSATFLPRFFWLSAISCTRSGGRASPSCGFPSFHPLRVLPRFFSLFLSDVNPRSLYIARYISLCRVREVYISSDLRDIDPTRAREKELH